MPPVSSCLLSPVSYSVSWPHSSPSLYAGSRTSASGENASSTIYYQGSASDFTSADDRKWEFCVIVILIGWHEFH